MQLYKTLIISLTFTILLSQITLSNQSANCNELVQNGTCDFYEKCIESKSFCGPTGYAMGYGTRYCKKFTKYIDVFPPKGQEWIRKTLICLKKALVPFEDEKDCKVIFNAAFDSHPQCYFEAGFCDLFLDPVHVPQLIKALVTVYEIKDFTNMLSMKQIFITGQKCHGDYFNRFIEGLKDFFSGKKYGNFEEEYKDLFA